ncbi:MAG: YbhB/YbcL family Raf kinase inhibitor-like protein [Steroidobacteraceae bacterium]
MRDKESLANCECLAPLIANSNYIKRGYNMKSCGNTGTPYLAHACLGISALIIWIFGASNALGDDHFDDHFRVNSTTFSNNGVLPISMIDNILSTGSNACSVDGSPGGNQSPEVSWAHAPWGTRSYVVAMFDVTASFTHWGMYNIPAWRNSLPDGAGAVGSTFGAQVYNDFYLQGYDGPCPPVGVEPYTHRYVLTVFALDEELQLPQSANFPPYAETLWYALVKATEEGHVLASASTAGFYSATPSP